MIRDVILVKFCDGGSQMHRKGNNRFFGRKRQDKKGKPKDDERESVHGRNLRIVAYPLVVVFAAIRALAFQIWLVLIVTCRATVHILPVRRDRNKYSPAEFEGVVTMSSPSRKSRPTDGGLGEQALTKQKSHHRKAFEYISKALKIDEEESIPYERTSNRSHFRGKWLETKCEKQGFLLVDTAHF